MSGYGANEQSSRNAMADFAAQYEALSDDEVLRIAADRKDLLEEACQALDQEMLRRGLKEPEVRQYQSDVERAEIREATNLRFWMRYGIGKRFFGKGAYVCHPGEKWEEFDTTLWVVVFYVPIFPVGTFRIRRSMKLRLLGPWQSYQFRVISRRGRDWRLIFATWGWLGFTLAILAIAIKVLNRFL